MRIFSRLVLFVGFIFATVVAASSQVHCQDDKVVKITVGYVAEGVEAPDLVKGVTDLHGISATLEPTIWMEKDKGGKGFRVAGVVYYKKKPRYENGDDHDTDTYAAGGVLGYRIGRNGLLEPWGRIVVGVRYITEREFTDIISAGLDVNVGHFGIRLVEVGRQKTRAVYEPKESYIGAGLIFRF